MWFKLFLLLILVDISTILKKHSNLEDTATLSSLSCFSSTLLMNVLSVSMSEEELTFLSQKRTAIMLKFFCTLNIFCTLNPWYDDTMLIGSGFRQTRNGGMLWRCWVRHTGLVFVDAVTCQSRSAVPAYMAVT